MFGKRGKYEAVPTEAAVKYKKKSTKSNLLSAYFTSLLCLILCATMFMSTSMAWFTSEVNNVGNEIYVGTLDVKLLHGTKEIIDNSDPVYDDSFVWAPDSLKVDEFTIENEGTLGFSYRMSMCISYEGVEAQEVELAQKAAAAITVWVKEGESGNPADFAAITAPDSGWTSVGTLADVLNGNAIVSGKMDPDLSTLNEGSTVVTTRKFAVALHMDTGASAEIMGAKLSNITIKLVAAQTASLTPVFTAEELQAAVAAGGNILLMNDVTVDADVAMTVPVGVTTNLYLNGYSISGVGDEAKATAIITNKGVLSIYDGAAGGKIELLDAVVDSGAGYATNTITNHGVLIVNGGHIQNNLGKASYAIDNSSGATTTINAGTVVNTQGTAIRAYGMSAESASTVVVNGGSITGTYGIRLQNLSTTIASKINVTVNGGTLTGTDSTYHMALYSMCNDGSNVNITLNGGTYVGDVAMGGGNKTNHETFAWTPENCTVYGAIYSYNTNVGTIYEDINYVLVNTAADFTTAVDQAEDGDVIMLLADITSDVTVDQKADVAFTIDGNGHTLTGAIVVDGKSARYDKAGVTIKNINFVADSISADACINLGVSGNNDTRYTNHVTVENCTFDVPGAVAIKSYTGGDKNLTVKDCVVSERCHSLLQVTNVEEGLVVSGCEVYSKNGANLNNTPSLEMSGCTFDVKGYAIRFGVSGTVNTEQKTFKITDSTLKAGCDDGDAVIMFRDSATKAKLTLVNTTVEGTTEVKGNTSDTVIDGLN